MKFFKIFAVLSILNTSCINQDVAPSSNRELVPHPEGNKKDSFVKAPSNSNKLLTKMNNKNFPFEVLEINGHYQITAAIESPALYPEYYNLFKKYNYEGNGYCWEGHITQILEQLDKELLKHIEFDPEAGSFVAHVDTKANQIKFMKILQPIFSELNKLEAWVKKANRSRIDD
jgi:hypothetical protein